MKTIEIVLNLENMEDEWSYSTQIFAIGSSKGEMAGKIPMKWIQPVLLNT